MLQTCYVTITLLNASEISRLVGASGASFSADIPNASLSSISFRITGGTLSSVARIVSRIICRHHVSKTGPRNPRGLHVISPV